MARGQYMQIIPSIEAIMDAVQSAEYIGFCLGCGAETDGVEPDAQKNTCEDCGEPQVYGAEELLIMFVA